MNGCIACGQDLHDECDSNPCCCSTEEKVIDEKYIPKVGKYLKTEIGTSAGRKRAAVAYAIISEKPCEWRWKANCGGGLFPIVGCLKGNQQHRHHGPVKNTARNEPENVHLICARCHNEWHAKNDPVYNESEFEKLPHNPRIMAPADMLESK